MAEEAVLQEKILQDLRSFGKYVTTFKIHKTSDVGIPDVFFSSKLTGAVFVEVKRKGEVPSPVQRKKIKDLNRSGCQAFYCDSWEVWVDLKAYLKLSLDSVI